MLLFVKLLLMMIILNNNFWACSGRSSSGAWRRRLITIIKSLFINININIINNLWACARQIFIGGLAPAATDRDVRAYFEHFGTVLEAQAPTHPSESPIRVTHPSHSLIRVTHPSHSLIRVVLPGRGGRDVCAREGRAHRDSSPAAARPDGGHRSESHTP